MAGMAISTTMISRLETALSAHIAVAIFIPAIVYLADSIGTQSDVVVVRGLSLTDSALLPLFFGELGAGALLGVTLGGLAFPFVWLAFSHIGLAATVVVALAVASTISTAFGFIMPWFFARLASGEATPGAYLARSRRGPFWLSVERLGNAALSMPSPRRASCRAHGFDVAPTCPKGAAKAAAQWQ
ncbi:MAG: magnesium transporter [Methylocystis sp.]